MGLFDWVGDVVNGIGSFLSDPLGLKNLGTGLPQSFSIAHNVNLAGKIDVNVNVTGKIQIEATLRTPDLVEAARLLRDGLTKFDLTGGALHQVINSYGDSNRHRQMLMELSSIVANGTAERATTEYYFEIGLVNDSTKIVSASPESPVLFQVEKLCRCLVSVDFNDQQILNNMLLGIGATPPGATLQVPPREEFKCRLDRVKDDNVVKVAVQQFGDPENLKPCRLQVRLVKRTQNWSYTVFEYIFDGESGVTPPIEAHVYIGKYIAVPIASGAKSVVLGKQIDALRAILEQPVIPPGVNTLPELAVGLIDFSRRRAVLARDIVELSGKFDKPNAKAFDVRTPFHLVLSNYGPGNLVATATVGAATMFSAVVLGPGDELAGRIPIDADLNNVAGPVTGSVKLRLQAQFTSRPAFYRAMIKSGLPWASETIFLSSNNVGDQELSRDITVDDFLK